MSGFGRAGRPWRVYGVGWKGQGEVKEKLELSSLPGNKMKKNCLSSEVSTCFSTDFHVSILQFQVLQGFGVMLIPRLSG